ncbi:hypothetical protein ACN42_g4891, partial [Penicillium freii]
MKALPAYTWNAQKWKNFFLPNQPTTPTTPTTPDYKNVTNYAKKQVMYEQKQKEHDKSGIRTHASCET